MSLKLRAYGTSLLLHLLLLIALLLFSKLSLQRTTKPLEIDLSLVEFEKEVSTPTIARQVESPRITPRESKALKEDKPSTESRPQALPSTLQREEEPPMEKPQTPTAQPSEVKTTPPAPSQTSANQATEPSPPPQPASARANTGIPRAQEEIQRVDAQPSPQAQREQYLKEKLAVISQIIQRNISYPPMARRMGWEGKVVLAIRICEDGSLKEVKVLESSGYEVLDRNAVETVRRVAPLFPKPPVEVVVKLPVSYKLE